MFILFLFFINYKQLKIINIKFFIAMHQNLFYFMIFFCIVLYFIFLDWILLQYHKNKNIIVVASTP